MSEPAAEPPAPPRSRRPLLTRRDLVRAALEAVLIVLSVFLALGVDAWRTEREVQQRVATARSYLIEELRTNRNRLRHDRVLPYHLRTQAMLRTAVGPPGPEQAAAVARIRERFEGVRPFRAQDVAWTTFRSSELSSRMEPEELFLLAGVYNAQENLADLSEILLAGLVQPSVDWDNPAYRRSQLEIFLIYFNDAVPAERELLQRYDAALQRLETDTAG